MYITQNSLQSVYLIWSTISERYASTDYARVGLDNRLEVEKDEVEEEVEEVEEVEVEVQEEVQEEVQVVPHWQYTDLFIFRFVSILWLRSTLRLFIYKLLS